MKGRKGPWKFWEILTTATSARNRTSARRMRIGMFGTEYIASREGEFKAFRVRGVRVTSSIEKSITKIAIARALSIFLISRGWLG